MASKKPNETMYVNAILKSEIFQNNQEFLF